MKRPVALLLLLAHPACTARTHWVTLPLAGAADLVSTDQAIAAGGREINLFPWAETSTGRAIWTLGVTTYLIWLCEWLHDGGHHGTAKIIEGLAAGLQLGAAGNNFKEARE